MSWITLSLLAPVAWAGANIIDKHLFGKYIKQPIIALMVFALVGAISSLAIYIFRGFAHTQLSLIGLGLLAGLIYLTANLFYFKAIQTEDASRVIALLYLDPLFTAVLSAIFLGEIFSPIKYFGIFLLVTGAVLVSYKKSQGLTINKAAWFCIVGAFLYATDNLIVKYLVVRVDYWTVFAYLRLGTFLGLLPAYFLRYKELWKFLKSGKGFVLALVSDTLGLIGILFFTIASYLGFVTLVTSLGAVQPFYVLMIGLGFGIFYPRILDKEKGGKAVFLQKLFAIILMFVGVILIT